MKPCRDCKEVKPLTEFIKNKAFKETGIDTLCKVCNRRRVYTWRKAGNRNSAEESRKYNLKHPEKTAARWSKRRAAKRNACPKWYGEEERFFFEEAHDLAFRRTKVFGFKWEVDHIIPLTHSLVCGLHVPQNLQVIPMVWNRSKSNKFEIGY